VTGNPKSVVAAGVRGLQCSMRTACGECKVAVNLSPSRQDKLRFCARSLQVDPAHDRSVCARARVNASPYLGQLGLQIPQSRLAALSGSLDAGRHRVPRSGNPVLAAQGAGNVGRGGGETVIKCGSR
jgi:hypothetical protein